VRFPAPTYADEATAFAAWEDGEEVSFSCVRQSDGVVTCDGRFLLPLREKVSPEATDEGVRSGPRSGAIDNDLSIAATSAGAQARAGEHRGEPSGETFRPLSPRPRRNPLPQGEKVGDKAGASRHFSPTDVAEYVALGGEAPPDGLVPEPMVSALFS
jgi:hypothetical protein